MRTNKHPKAGGKLLIYLKLIDTIYFFNNITLVVSEYTITETGYIYSVNKHSAIKYDNYLQVINMNKLTVDIQENEFYQFCELLNNLQEDSQLLKPLLPFDQHIKTITDKYNIHLRKNY